MTKAEKDRMAKLEGRVVELEKEKAQARTLAAAIFEAIQPDLQALVEEEVGIAVDDLQIVR